MLLAPSLTLSGGLVVILIAWLCASWYFLDLAHGLLFGRQRHERQHEDLRPSELASLAIVLSLLVALGVVPARLFDPEPATIQQTAGMHAAACIKETTPETPTPAAWTFAALFASPVKSLRSTGP